MLCNEHYMNAVHREIPTFKGVKHLRYLLDFVVKWFAVWWIEVWLVSAIAFAMAVGYR